MGPLFSIPLTALNILKLPTFLFILLFALPKALFLPLFTITGLSPEPLEYSEDCSLFLATDNLDC